jgi:hypothetical protein
LQSRAAFELQQLSVRYPRRWICASEAGSNILTGNCYNSIKEDGRASTETKRQLNSERTLKGLGKPLATHGVHWAGILHAIIAIGNRNRQNVDRNID